MSAESGQMLSHYRLVEKIGEGGMGVVWKAKDTVLARTVAIKVLPADLALDEDRRRMFLHEARLAAAVSHGNIVQVHELGREGDLDFIVMEYVEGKPLSRMLHGRPLPPDQVAELGLQIAQGLTRAHHKKLIHRDLKPSNILVTDEGDVKIVDFGLAMLFASPESTTATLTTALEHIEATRIAGTWPYMSPEQVRGERLDARSDIFSFGSVLYEMTTGQRPFQGATVTAIAQEILRCQPRPARELVPQVPLDLDRIVEKSLAPRPQYRYQTMDDLAVDLKRLGRELESGSAPSYPSLQPPVQKERPEPRGWLRALAVLGVAAAVGVAIWFLWLRPQGVQNEVQPAEAARRNWILVADFDGPADDPNLAAATRELVTAALSYSEVVRPLTRAQLNRGLRLAMKPDTTRVSGAVAQELATRAGCAAYVEGRVDRIMRGYSIVLRVLEADHGSLVGSISGTAENDEVFIATVDRLGRDLRRTLGEQSSAIEQSTRTHPVMTPSFEAYRLFIQAIQFGDGLDGHARDFEASIRFCREALALDPDFAAAWRRIGINSFNIGFRDSALVAFEEARRRPERLSSRERTATDAYIAMLRCDFAQATRLFDAIGLQNNKGVLLSVQGRYEEALREYQVGAQSPGPFASSMVFVINQFEALMMLGRREEASALAMSMEGPARLTAQLVLALSASDWTLAESLATNLQDFPTAAASGRFMSRLALASMRAGRGEIRAAVQTMERLRPEAPNSDWVQETALAEILLSTMVAKVGLENASAPLDTTTSGNIVQGIWVALLDDSSMAKQYLERASARPCDAGRSHRTDLKFLQALIASKENDWNGVIELAEPATTDGWTPYLTGRLPIRWLVAEAYEKLGHEEKAIEAFDRVLSTTGFASRYTGQEECVRAIYYSFAHQRLVLLCAKTGRVEDARRHLEFFEKMFTHPDPELVPMIEEARHAVAEAGAKL